jgi:hypothetical protein
MKTMNCRSVQRQIDEAGPGDLLGTAVSDHIKSCAECGQFSQDDLKLRGMMSNLGTIEAPGDFEFRLRARLAGKKQRAVPFGFDISKVGFRTASLATLVLLIGVALFVASFRKAPDNSPRQLAARESEQPITLGQPGMLAANPIKVDAASDTAQSSSPSIPTNRRRNSSTSRAASRRLGTRDMASRPATVLRPEELTAGRREFPIRASSQPLKVSLDDGRGTSRTISLPGVSFGSQRVVAQNTSPLLASARGDW